MVLFLSVSFSPTILPIDIILKQAFSTKGLKQPQCPLLLQLLFQVEKDFLFSKNANKSPSTEPYQTNLSHRLILALSTVSGE